jgi:hypothetical protein
MTVEVYSILYAEEKWRVTGTSSVTSSGSTLPVAGEPGKLCLVIFDQDWVQMRSHDIGISREYSWPARTSILCVVSSRPRCRRAYCWSHLLFIFILVISKPVDQLFFRVLSQQLQETLLDVAYSSRPVLSENLLVHDTN